MLERFWKRRKETPRREPISVEGEPISGPKREVQPSNLLEDLGIGATHARISMEDDLTRAQYLAKLLKFKQALQEVHHYTEEELENKLDKKLREHDVHELKLTIPWSAWEKLNGIGIKLPGQVTSVITVSKPQGFEAPVLTVLESVEKMEGHKRYIGNRISAIFGRKLTKPYVLVKEGPERRPETRIIKEWDISGGVSRVHGNIEVLPNPRGDGHIVIIRHTGNKNLPIIVEFKARDGRIHTIQLGNQ